MEEIQIQHPEHVASADGVVILGGHQNQANLPFSFHLGSFSSLSGPKVKTVLPKPKTVKGKIKLARLRMEEEEDDDKDPISYSPGGTISCFGTNFF